MKVAIVSDTQFDEQLSYATILATGLSSRLHDSIACFGWVVHEAKLRGCKQLFHLGDVFDSRTTIDVSVLDQVGRAFFAAHDDGMELVLLVGNHDSYLRTPAVNSLWPFAGVATIVDEPMVLGSFALCPWIEDDDAFAKEVNRLANDPKAKFLFSHCMVEGSVPNVPGIRPLAALMPKRWRQVVLGDVHDPVQVAPNVRYCGSPMQWHYGDAGGTRGFLVLDTASGAIEFVENELSPRFHKLAGFNVDVSEVTGGPQGPRGGDFVRITSEIPWVAREIEEELSTRQLRRLESVAVELPDQAPRLDVRVTNPHEEVLRRYVEHVGMGEVDGLVEAGLEILEAVKNG